MTLSRGKVYSEEPFYVFTSLTELYWTVSARLETARDTWRPFLVRYQLYLFALIFLSTGPISVINLVWFHRMALFVLFFLTFFPIFIHNLCDHIFDLLVDEKICHSHAVRMPSHLVSYSYLTSLCVSYFSYSFSFWIHCRTSSNSKKIHYFSNESKLE